MLMQATRASHVEYWWTEVSKADVVDSERGRGAEMANAMAINTGGHLAGHQTAC